ncbi:MAG: hypothetical protein WCL14_07795 [Bacteroidota bacterium]
MIDYKQWLENIYSSIDSIADLPSQEEIWLGKSKKYVSDYGETISDLYDSFCFGNDFWKEQHLSNFNLKEDLLIELKTLKRMIDIYDEKIQITKLKDEKILKDPEWIFITKQATKIVEIWKADNYPIPSYS